VNAIEQNFRIERRDNPAGFPVYWVIDARGVERRASEAEAWLWDRLQEAKGLLEEAQQRHEAEEREVASRGKRR
jgi:hypothetical protein